MDENTTSESYRSSEMLGVCIKSLDRRVRFQNQACVALCGEKKCGELCEQGCMLHYKSGVGDRSFDQGLRLFRNIDVPQGRADAVVINDGAEITTLLLKSRRLLSARLPISRHFVFLRRK